MITPAHLRALVLLGVFAAAAGCQDRKPDPIALPDVARTLPNLIVPANAGVVSRSGSEDALSVVLRAPGHPDSVAQFYVGRLKPPVWRLVSQSKDNLGAHVLYAEQEGPPLWIRIWADTVNNGTYVRLTGAAQVLSPESAPVDTAVIP